MIASIKRRIENISNQMVMGILIGIALTMVAGSIGSHIQSGNVNWWEWLDGFLQNFGTEMFGAFLTFWLIEVLVGNRDKKERLIREIGSPDDSTTSNAVRELRDRGWLTDGSLRGGNFAEASLISGDLYQVNFEEAMLVQVRLEKADLRKANLKKAKLMLSNLVGANLEEADLEEAFLLQANIRDVNFTLANLKGAAFTQSDLTGSNFQMANLEGADFTLANLQRAERITVAQLKASKTLEGATLPDGTTLPQRENWVTDLIFDNWKEPFTEWCNTVQVDEYGYIIFAIPAY